MSETPREHPFDGPEMFDDTMTVQSVDPWPTISDAVRELVAARRTIRKVGDPVYVGGVAIGAVSRVWLNGDYAIRLNGVDGEYTRSMLQGLREIGATEIDHADD